MLGKHEPERVTRVRISPPPQRKSRRAGQRCWDVYIRFANVLRHRLPMFYYTYILQSTKDGKYYTGISNNIERRFQQHNIGYSSTRYTRNRGPFELIFVQVCEDRKLARELEKFLKSGSGRELRDELLK